MGKLYAEIIPTECVYCSEKVTERITWKTFMKRITVHVCKDCSKEIWNQETNRLLP